MAHIATNSKFSGEGGFKLIRLVLLIIFFFRFNAKPDYALLRGLFRNLYKASETKEDPNRPYCWCYNTKFIQETTRKAPIHQINLLSDANQDENPTN